MNSDTAISSSMGQDVTMAPGGCLGRFAQAQKQQWLLDSNIFPCGGRDPEQLYDP